MNMPTDREAMQHMWDAASKLDEAGTRFLTFVGEKDVLNLYYNGTFYKPGLTAKQFLEAFRSFHQKSGSFKLTHEQWMPFEKYYAGPLQPAWDPWTIRDGQWSESEFRELYKTHISRESTLPPEFVEKFLETARAQSLIKNGHMMVDDTFKAALTQVINRHPAPPRRRWMETIAYQLALEQLAEKAGGKKTSGSLSPAEAARDAANQRAAMGAKQLKDLEKVKTVSDALIFSEAETVSLADLKKKRSTPRTV